MIARIAVAAAVYAIDKPYSYRIPAGTDVRPGMRVRVPFGAGNRRTEGVILALEAGDETGLKSIDEVLDDTPVSMAIDEVYSGKLTLEKTDE